MSDGTEMKFNCVFLADILGFMDRTMKYQAKDTLKTYFSIAAELIEPYKNSKRFQFSDSIVIGFMDIEEAISFSQSFFKRTFDEEIPIRGAIGIGEFTYIPEKNLEYFLTFGHGLILSSIVEKYHLKGHACLLICENSPRNQHIYDRKYLEKYEHEDLPSKLLYFLLSWWDNSDEIKRIIDDRTHGLSCEDIIYLEKTRENLDHFKNKERIAGSDEW